MELFQNKAYQRELDVYSSQRHLVDTDIYSASEETSISIKDAKSPVKYNPQKKSKNFVEKISKFGQDNPIYQTDDNKSDESQLLSDSSSKHKNDSKITNDYDKIESFNNDLNTVLSRKLGDTSNSSQNSPNNTYPIENVASTRSPVKEGNDLQSDTSENVEIKAANSNELNDFKTTGVYIYKSDVLKLHPHLFSCDVKIDLYNWKRGKCLNNSKHYTASIQTHRWESHKRYVEPQWNELVIFESTLVKLIEKNTDLIIFFQVRSVRKNVELESAGNEVVTWSFLKLVKDTRKNYLNKKVKLQMFEPLNSKNNSFEIYNCWKTRSWKTYPSTIQVTLKGYRVNKDDEYINTIQYSIHNLMKQYSTTHKGKGSVKQLSSEDYYKRDVKEKCQIFNSISKTIQDDNKACFTMKFSSCGKYLAFATSDDDAHNIMILKVPSFTQEAKLVKHTNIIYDISWNSTNNLLISASSDCTVCVWEFVDSKFVLKQQLSHEAFVYSARFCEIPECVIATGCFDKLVRVWKTNRGKKFNLHQELDGHEGFINALCFDKQARTLYSGDSVGLIIKWNCSNDDWHHQLSIRNSEVRNHIINDLIIFPNNQKMLIVLRDSVAWTLDLGTSTILLCYKDGISCRYQLRGCISPCGSLIFIGNCIWNATTAQLLAMFNPLIFDNQIVTAIDYHPFYNVASIACGLTNSPILICSHRNSNEDEQLNIDIFGHENETIQQQLAGVKIHDTNITKSEIKTTPKSFQTKGDESNHSLCETEIHSSKLWHLINKMDLVISTVRKEKKIKNDVVETTKQLVEKNFLKKINKSPKQQIEIFDKDELNIDITSQNSDVTYTIIENDDKSTLSEAESIHTYTVSPKHNIKPILQ